MNGKKEEIPMTTTQFTEEPSEKQECCVEWACFVDLNYALGPLAHRIMRGSVYLIMIGLDVVLGQVSRTKIEK